MASHERLAKLKRVVGQRQEGIVILEDIIDTGKTMTEFRLWLNG